MTQLSQTANRNEGAHLTTTACPRCNAAVASGAQFCGSCGASLSAAPPPPMPPPAPQPPQPPIPNIPGMQRGFTGGAGQGQSKQATFSGSPQDAYNQAIGAIQKSGGELLWQQAPQAAKFLLSHKNIWSTGGVVLKYDGDLQILPAGAGQTTARFSLKVQWNSVIPLILLQVVAVVFAAMFNYAIAAFFFILVVVGVGVTAWNASSGIPEKQLDIIIKNLSGGAAPAAQAQQHYAPPAAPQPQAYTPPPVASPPPAPAPQPAPAAPDNTATIVEQIKQLAGLRDAGAITADEFEAKKAELLKRI